MSTMIEYDNLPDLPTSMDPLTVLDAFTNELRRVEASLKGSVLLLKDETLSEEAHQAVLHIIERQSIIMNSLLNLVKRYVENYK